MFGFSHPIKKVELNLCIIYREPNFSVLTLIDEFGSYTGQNLNTSSETVFTGDYV